VPLVLTVVALVGGVAVAVGVWAAVVGAHPIFTELALSGLVPGVVAGILGGLVAAMIAPRYKVAVATLAGTLFPPCFSSTFSVMASRTARRIHCCGTGQFGLSHRLPSEDICHAAVCCRLTNRWSGRVRDKVPSSCSSARAAQLNR